MPIGDKWRKWRASDDYFNASRSQHPRQISAKAAKAKLDHAERLAKLKAERAARIAARRNPKR
jgi:hypothetical protein